MERQILDESIRADSKNLLALRKNIDSIISLKTKPPGHDKKEQEEKPTVISVLDDNNSKDGSKSPAELGPLTLTQVVRPKNLLPQMHNKTLFKAAMEYAMGTEISTRTLKEHSEFVEKQIQMAKQ